MLRTATINKHGRMSKNTNSATSGRWGNVQQSKTAKHTATIQTAFMRQNNVPIASGIMFGVFVGFALQDDIKLIRTVCALDGYLARTSVLQEN